MPSYYETRPLSLDALTVRVESAAPDSIADRALDLHEVLELTDSQIKDLVTINARYRAERRLGARQFGQAGNELRPTNPTPPEPVKSEALYEVRGGVLIEDERRAAHYLGRVRAILGEDRWLRLGELYVEAWKQELEAQGQALAALVDPVFILVRKDTGAQVSPTKPAESHRRPEVTDLTVPGQSVPQPALTSH